MCGMVALGLTISFAVVLEKDGVIRHMRTDQFKVLRNDTFDISNEQT